MQYCNQLQACPPTNAVLLCRVVPHTRFAPPSTENNCEKGRWHISVNIRTRHVRSSTECTGNYVSQILQMRENTLERNWRYFLSQLNKTFQSSSMILSKGRLHQRMKPLTILVITLGRVIRTPPNFWCLTVYTWRYLATQILQRSQDSEILQPYR
jgi:hypothetical protein